ADQSAADDAAKRRGRLAGSATELVSDQAAGRAADRGAASGEGERKDRGEQQVPHCHMLRAVTANPVNARAAAFIARHALWRRRTDLAIREAKSMRSKMPRVERAYPLGRIVGKAMTSRIEALSVSSMTSRSIPMPSPPVGGRPYSSAVT